jgi:hypothetical protein
LKRLPKRVKDSVSKRPAKVRQVKGFARRHRRGKPRMAGYRDVDSVIQEGRQLLFEKSSGRGPLRLMASTSQVTTAERLQLVKVGGVPNTSETIKPGSHVEVSSLLVTDTNCTQMTAALPSPWLDNLCQKTFFKDFFSLILPNVIDVQQHKRNGTQWFFCSHYL